MFRLHVHLPGCDGDFPRVLWDSCGFGHFAFPKLGLNPPVIFLGRRADRRPALNFMT